jgi:hypothetical protein
LKKGRKLVAIKDVIAQDQHGMVLPDEFAPDDKRLR